LTGEAQNPRGASRAPPAFGTAPAVGPEVTPAPFAEAEKLVQVELTAADRAEVAGGGQLAQRDGSALRATGRPRKVIIEPTVAPWSRWDATLPGTHAGPEQPLCAEHEQCWASSEERRGDWRSLR